MFKRQKWFSLQAAHKFLYLQEREDVHCGCRLYESICPLNDQLVQHLTHEFEPFCTVNEMEFDKANSMSGPWRNYLVGVVGSIAPDEDDVLWPNQVNHTAHHCATCDS